MNESNELNQEIIPGTNIPRPRAREVMESDQEYVEYLKAYYEKYFPENQTEEVKSPVVEESSVQFSEISNEELNEIYQNLEEYADNIVVQEQNNPEPVISETEPIKSEETLFDIKVEEDQVENDFTFDTKVNEEEKDTMEVAFDTSVDSEEIIGFTPSNETITSKIRTPQFLTKIVNFFTARKAQMDNLVSKANEYFEDISVSLEKEELIPAVGRAR